MGREAHARRLRRVIRALAPREAAQLGPQVAAQYRVRVRTLRRGVLERVTGSFSSQQIGQAFLAHRKLKESSLQEAVSWCASVRAQHPAWRPGDAVPEGVK